MDFYVPVMARFNLTPGFYMEAGVNARFNFLSRFYNGYDWYDWDSYKTFNFGIGAGLGYTFFFGLEIDGRFEYGLTKEVKHSDVGTARIEMDLAYWFIK